MIIPVSQWLIPLASCCPLGIGLWDPFQMAIHGLQKGVILTTETSSWDDPPTRPIGTMAILELPT